MISNLLSSNEITDILNNPIVNSNKEKLSTLDKVDFSIQLSDEIKNKLETGLSINLSQLTSIPMRWIKGDTISHMDKGEKHFDNTYLLYLTDSIGNLMIDGQSYPICAGDAHVFSEGVEHSTINTGDSERLMIGPMSETGFRVGVAITIIYFNNETDANLAAATTIANGYPDTTNYIVFSGTYTINTVDDISSWNIATNVYGTSPSPNGGPYNDGTALIETGVYYVYPYITTSTATASAAPAPRMFSMRSLFTNNAQVYYKSHSLSTGSGGSGVKNSRHKKRKT
jgi:hypothetical protein